MTSTLRARTPLALMVAAAALWLAGCPDVVEPTEYADPSSLADDTVQNGIHFRVIAPEGGEPLQSASSQLVVSAYTDEATNLRVIVGPLNGEGLIADATGAAGPAQEFTAPISLTHGVNTFRIRILELDGARRIRTVEYPLVYDGDAPGVQILSLRDAVDGGCPADAPVVQGITNQTAVCVHGRATSADAELTGVELSTDGVIQVSADVSDSGAFAGPVEVATNARSFLRAVASDTAGAESFAEVWVDHDGVPPTVAVSDPASNPYETSASAVPIAGSASDANGLDSIRIETVGRGTTFLPVGESWSFEVALETGENRFAVIATDIAGNEGRVEVVMIRDRIIRLRPAMENQGTAVLEIDRFGVEELLDEQAQRDLDLVSIELRPFVVATLEAIQNPERFGIDQSGWGFAEWNLYRLLNMTPDTADLSGTSIEELLAISSGIGLPAPRVLAELLDIEVTETFLELEAVADSMLENVIGTHPSATRNDDGELVLAVSMFDALSDLTTLSGRFGPSGDHPGFLIGEVRSQVFEPGFTMSVSASTNLTQLEGVDAARGGKDFIFVLEGDQVLQFDFLDSDSFNVVGLVDEPTLDLRFFTGETDQFYSAGRDRNARPAPGRDGWFLGDSAAWDIDSWNLEHVVIEAAYNSFWDRFEDSGYQRTFRYDTGAIVDAAVINWDRGWVEITTSGGVGNPPDPTYIWGFLTEAAQVRLHDNGLAEGEGDVVFELLDLPIGLDSRELIDALQPELEAQQDELSDVLFGDSGGLAPSGVDFYYVQSEGAGNGFLFFRDPVDTGDTDPYSNPRPGFFSDPGLTQLVSSTGAMSGTSDTIHHKVPVSVGAEFYIQDDAGGVFLIEIADVDDGSVGLLVQPVGGP